MEIIKKSGRLEDYNKDKVKRSIAAASDESKEPLTESEINRLVHDFDQIVAEKKTITSRQISIIVSGLLYTNGYLAALEKYMKDPSYAAQ